LHAAARGVGEVPFAGGLTSDRAKAERPEVTGEGDILLDTARFFNVSSSAALTSALLSVIFSSVRRQFLLAAVPEDAMRIAGLLYNPSTGAEWI
jgi:hypothetical protein